MYLLQNARYRVAINHTLGDMFLRGGQERYNTGRYRLNALPHSVVALNGFYSLKASLCT